MSETPHDPATEPAEGFLVPKEGQPTDDRGLPTGEVPYVQPEEPPVPHVTAYDPDMRVLYGWTQAHFGTLATLEALQEASRGIRMAEMAIAEAALIRTREGVILKDTHGLAGTSIAENDLLVLPDQEDREEGRVIRHGKRRMELLEPPVEEHKPLDEGEQLLVALWAVLMDATSEGEAFISDEFIARAKAPGASLSLERFRDGFTVRAHQAEPLVIPLGEGGDDDDADGS